jgi:hypothetical protein
MSALPTPAIALPRQEQEGAAWFWIGTQMKSEQATDGFAFCQYPFGSLERQNWIAGYASQAFNPNLIEGQMAGLESPSASEQAPEAAA